MPSIEERNVPKEVVSGMVPTKNKTGYMFTERSKFSNAFIDYASSSQLPVLDIACAYGVTTIDALARSTIDVFALDPSAEHLEILENQVSHADKSRLKLIQGYFPDDLEFDQGSLGAIHMANILHYLRGEQIEVGLDICHQILGSQGKLFITLNTAYLSLFEDYLQTYESRKNKGAKFPGEILNFSAYVPIDLKCYVPEFIHVFKLEDFQALIQSHGFEVEAIEYFDLDSVDVKSDGRGWLGVIAHKV